MFTNSRLPTVNTGCSVPNVSDSGGPDRRCHLRAVSAPGPGGHGASAGDPSGLLAATWLPMIVLTPRRCSRFSLPAGAVGRNRRGPARPPRARAPPPRPQHVLRPVGPRRPPGGRRRGPAAASVAAGDVRGDRAEQAGEPGGARCEALGGCRGAMGGSLRVLLAGGVDLQSSLAPLPRRACSEQRRGM